MKLANVPVARREPSGRATSPRAPQSGVSEGADLGARGGVAGHLGLESNGRSFASARTFGILATALLLAGSAGCVGPNGGGATADPGAAEDAYYQLDESVAGKIVLVNAAMQFVVMDFPLRRLPALEQRLDVFRAGQKVGEIRVTGPVREMTVAGEILSGNPEAGDEVREE